MISGLVALCRCRSLEWFRHEARLFFDRFPISLEGSEMVALLRHTRRPMSRIGQQCSLFKCLSADAGNRLPGDYRHSNPRAKFVPHRRNSTSVRITGTRRQFGLSGPRGYGDSVPNTLSRPQNNLWPGAAGRPNPQSFRPSSVGSRVRRF